MRIRRNKSLFFSSILFGVMCVLTALRGISVGNDTQSYLFLFDVFAQKGIIKNFNIEYGYQLFCVIISWLFKRQNAIIISSAILSYWLIYNYLKKNSSLNTSFAIIFFLVFFNYYLSGIRQGIAMAILLYAFSSVREKKLFKSILFIVLASSFHLASISFIPFVILCNKKRLTQGKAIILFFFVGFFSLFLRRVLIDIIVSLIPRYSLYFTAQGGLFVGQLGVSLSLICFIFIFIYVNTIAKSSDDYNANCLLWASFFMIIYCLFAFITHIFTRVSMLFELPILIYVCDAIDCNKLSVKWCFFIGFFFAVLIVQIIFRPEWIYFLNYSFFVEI